MKKRISLISAIIIAAFAVCLLIWRFWPQSSSNLISVDENAVTNFASSVMVQRLVNGQTHTDAYLISTERQGYQSNELGDILEILATSKYQQDFRNLSPWRADSVESDKNYDGRTALLVFSVGNQEDEMVSVDFLSSSIITVSVGGEDGFHIYHPTNSKTLDALVEYFQTHGMKQ